MKIREVIIDGFKSYPKETILTGFDPHFNAITGLNGSGKSNILDAICFVLGITHVTHLRASKLQELVYKQGHSGVTTAEVSIIFDNNDKDKSPPTLKHLDAVTVRREVKDGQSKYFINGKCETQDKVRTLFTSIQLNINNPQFLVLQGRISKIIQTQPKELLSLLVEAAGLSLFDIKKQNALKMIKRKQAKVDETESLLEKDIGPKFDRLQKEQKDFIRYKEVEGCIKKVGKDIKIQEYLLSRDRKSKLSLLVDKEVVRVDILKEKIKESKEKFNAELTKLKSIKKTELAQLKSDSDSVVHKAQAIEKKMVEIKSLINRKEKMVKENVKSQKKLSKFIETCDQNIFKAKSERKEYKDLKKLVKKDYQSKKELMKKAQDNLQKIEEGKAVSIIDLLHNQLKEMEKKDGVIDSEICKIKTSIKFYDKEIEESKKKIDNFDQMREKVTSKIAQISNKCEDKRKIIDDLPDKKRREKDLREDIQELERSHKRLQREIEELSVQTTLRATKRLLNISGVIGYVMDSFSIKEDKYLLALETIAGGRLSNIVTKNVQSAETVINEAKKSTARVFVYPNDKMRSNPLSRDVKTKLSDNYGNDAIVATDTIDFNFGKVGNSMLLLFGSTVICKNSKIAKEIAFSSEYGYNSVTLEGDQFEPSGMLRGGYTKKKLSLLQRVQDIKKRRCDEKTLLDSIQKKKDELQVCVNENNVRREHERELEILLHEKSVLKDQISGEDTKRRLTKEYKEHVDTKTISEKKIENLQKMKETNSKDIESIQAEIDAIKGTENTKEAFEHQILKLREEIEKIKVLKKAHQKEIDMTDFKEEANTKQKRETERDFEKEKKEHDRLMQEKADLENEKKELEKEKDLFRDKINRINESQKRLNKDINTSSNNQKEESQKINKYMIELTDREANIKKAKQELDSVDYTLSSLLKEAPWLNEECETTSHRRIGETSIQKMKVDYKKMKEEIDHLRKRVNPDVNELVNETEVEMERLTTRRDIIMHDKQMIEKVIQDLEVEKKKAIEKAYEITNGYIQSIYSTVLPEAKARIDMVNQFSLEEGIELKVQFSSGDDVSLTGLSGGQRSLLALSFILSLLKLKPAPFYILDEIDAALDTSHTNNIGKMIKNHFGESQFIIISLKQEMFNQANVRYHVSFKEGISQVERIKQKKTI
ncbi:unnamed protein product [Moneuplotes crassus]|uniref:SMC hinge domain-containing protein n=1 Tax=Euplotes crassus TaxID=5936 RepID=A0AAD1UGL5_EUPCR|nr:unnamed protein product [Moneuplotes crassus]